jgi:hypothetical protein
VAKAAPLRTPRAHSSVVNVWTSRPRVGWRGLATLGGDPLVNSTAPWRYLALGVPAAGLAFFGAFAFARRDVRAA